MGCFFFPHCMPSGILAPRPGSEPRAITVLTTVRPGNSLWYLFIYFFLIALFTELELFFFFVSVNSKNHKPKCAEQSCEN